MKLRNSKNLFKKTIKKIPLASQTFSKSYLFFDKKYSPLFSAKGDKQFIFDVDGNKYLDLINGLGSVSIGYNISSINKKISAGLNNGITFSLSHPLELEAAKQISSCVKSAQMIRFGKNGSDATSAAIRLARHYTKRNKIAVCGYHGWHDWYISSTSMNGGIPNYINKDIDKFEFNNIQSLEKLLKKNKYAAIIIEPLSIDLPKNNFLKKVETLCKKNKALLIFDEICTGFRVSMGGAQKIYNVNPDLTTLGKGIANGMPMSALVGKKRIMNNAKNIFFSGTFGGETLSLISCIETIKFMKRKKTINKIIRFGKKVKKELNNYLKNINLSNEIELSGHPAWLYLKIKNKKINSSNLIKSYIFQELVKNKILFLGSFNLNYSFTNKDIEKILYVFKKIFYNIKINIGNLKQKTYYKVPQSIFKVRSK
jgi:glutamate-1-semialdehyde 2,1-aminomutase